MFLVQTITKSELLQFLLKEAKLTVWYMHVLIVLGIL